MLLIAVAVLPSFAAAFILWQMFTEQLDASSEKRLLTAVETFQLILEHKAEALTGALSRMASDNTLQVTMNLEILPQMNRYLEAHYELTGFEFLHVHDTTGGDLASFGNTLPLRNHAGLCGNMSITVVNRESGFYLVKTVPVVQNDTTIGYLCGGVDLRNKEFGGYLTNTLRSTPFVRWQDRTIVLGQRARRTTIPESSGKGVFSFMDDQREYKGMTSQITIGQEQLDIGVLIAMVEREEGRDQFIRSMIALMSVIALVVFFALRFHYLRSVASKELMAEKERALVTLSSIGDAVFTTDDQGLVRFLNSAACQLLGSDGGDVIGKPWNETLVLRDEGSEVNLEDPIAECLHKKEMIRAPRNAVLVRKHKNIPVNYTAAPIGVKSSLNQGVVLVIRDVSQERQLQNRLAWKAKRDDLTGLFNRSEFRYRVEQALLDAKERDLEYALLYLDLDQFKVVNDSCGHHVGDQVLKQISSLLRSQLRAADTLFRLGGDEFGILLEGCPPDQAYQVATDLCETVKSNRVTHTGHIFEIGVSIGLVSLDANSGRPEEVISCVDSACYSAKEEGRNRVHVYTPADGKHDRRFLEMAWVPRIRAALRENRFCLYAQPIVQVHEDSGHTESHLEILLRMVDEEGELVSPGAFIPVAERFGLMPEIDRWVMARLFSSYAELSSRMGPSLYSINLSGASLADPDLGRFVVESLKKYQIPSHVMCFEITETEAVTQIDKAGKFIELIKSVGCSFMLDDFGTGMSSFGYLKALPVDFLKIDGLFVKDILVDPVDYAMVKTINEIGHILGLKTVAEYVENTSVLERLREIGIDYAQGFGIAKPRPLILPDASLATPTEKQIA